MTDQFLALAGIRGVFFDLDGTLLEAIHALLAGAGGEGSGEQQMLAIVKRQQGITPSNFAPGSGASSAATPTSTGSLASSLQPVERIDRMAVFR
jgi:hypothetical protein